MARNLFGVGDVLAAGQQGWDDTQAKISGIENKATAYRAGRAYAGGDRQGAAAALAQGGNIQGARAIEGDIADQEQQTYQRGRQEQADQRQMSQDERAAAEQKVQAFTRVAQGLMTVPPGQRTQALQRALPLFQQMGMDPAQFASLTEDQLSDDQLKLFVGELEKQWQGINLGNGGVASFNNRDGAFKVLREPDPKMVSVPGGNTLFDPEARAPVYTAPKTFAPRAPRAAASGGGDDAALRAIEAELRRRGKL